MIKVVTIPVCSIGSDTQSKERSCYEYADLDKLFENGWRISSTLQNESAKTITFILKKN